RLRGGLIPRLESRARPPARARVAGPDYPPPSVAIASYNRRDELAATVEALAGQSYPAERFEAVIVLDGSADGSAERVRGIDVPYPLRLIEQENKIGRAHV